MGGCARRPTGLMSQIFPRSANTLSRVSIVGAVLLIGLLLGLVPPLIQHFLANNLNRPERFQRTFGCWLSLVLAREAGVKDPVVDALLAKLVYAPDRAALVTAAHALDRVLLWGDYVVPNWYSPVHRLAWRNRFAHPQTLPLYYQPIDWVISSWWAK